VCNVRQRRHSREPKWFRRMYGSYYECVREGGGGRGLRTWFAGVRKGFGTDLVQVNNTHSDFAQTLSPVDIGLRCPGDTTATEL
jgi:hypothetical protein